jgi:hypothetical protein
MNHANILERGLALLATALLLTFGLCSKTTVAQTTVPTTPDPKAIVRSARTIYVKSSSVLVGGAVIEAKLRKRSEFQQLGLIITRDPDEADLILQVKHDLFTMYTYTAIDPHTSIVVASGKLSSLGGTVAGKVAKRFLKQMLKARV